MDGGPAVRLAADAIDGVRFVRLSPWTWRRTRRAPYQRSHATTGGRGDLDVHDLRAVRRARGDGAPGHRAPYRRTCCSSRVVDRDAAEPIGVVSLMSIDPRCAGSSWGTSGTRDRRNEACQHRGGPPVAPRGVRHVGVSARRVEVRRAERLLCGRRPSGSGSRSRASSVAHDREGPQQGHPHGSRCWPMSGRTDGPRWIGWLETEPGTAWPASSCPSPEPADAAARSVCGAVTVVSLVNVESPTAPGGALQGADPECLTGPASASWVRTGGKSTPCASCRVSKRPGGEVVRGRSGRSPIWSSMWTATITAGTDGAGRMALTSPPSTLRCEPWRRSWPTGGGGRPHLLDRVFTQQQDRWIDGPPGGAGLPARHARRSSRSASTAMTWALLTSAPGAAQAGRAGRLPDPPARPAPARRAETAPRRRSPRPPRVDRHRVPRRGGDGVPTTGTCSTRPSRASPSLDGGRITIWPGNYSTFAVAKEIALKRKQLYVTAEGDRE